MTTDLDAVVREVRHDPTYMSGGRAYWAACSCGWASEQYRGPAGAQLEFGRHLLDQQAGSQ